MTDFCVGCIWPIFCCVWPTIWATLNYRRSDERWEVSIVLLRIQRLHIIAHRHCCCCCLRHQLQPMPSSANKSKCSCSSLNNNAPSAHLAVISAAVPAVGYLSLEAYSSCGRTPSVSALGLGLFYDPLLVLLYALGYLRMDLTQVAAQRLGRGFRVVVCGQVVLL